MISLGTSPNELVCCLDRGLVLMIIGWKSWVISNIYKGNKWVCKVNIMEIEFSENN